MDNVAKLKVTKIQSSIFSKKLELDAFVSSEMIEFMYNLNKPVPMRASSCRFTFFNCEKKRQS